MYRCILKEKTFYDFVVIFNPSLFTGKKAIAIRIKSNVSGFDFLSGVWMLFAIGFLHVVEPESGINNCGQQQIRNQAVDKQSRRRRNSGRRRSLSCKYKLRQEQQSDKRWLPFYEIFHGGDGGLGTGFFGAYRPGQSFGWTIRFARKNQECGQKSHVVCLGWVNLQNFGLLRQRIVANVSFGVMKAQRKMFIVRKIINSRRTRQQDFIFSEPGFQ